MARPVRLALSAAAVLAAALPSSAAALPGGYQFDGFRIVGPGRMVVEVSAPKQVPSLPASTRGYHELCTTSVSPILRYRVRYSAPGDSAGFTLRAQWARPGSTSYAPFGTDKPYLLEGSTFGAPKTIDLPLVAPRFLPGGTPVPTAPPAALLDLRVIVGTSFWVPLPIPGYGDLGYAIPTEKTLQTKLDFRVSSSPTCPTPNQYPQYFKAR